MHRSIILLKWIQAEHAGTIACPDMDDARHDLVRSTQKIYVVWEAVGCIACTTSQDQSLSLRNRSVIEVGNTQIPNGKDGTQNPSKAGYHHYGQN
jgi:hypothetical protein